MALRCAFDWVIRKGISVMVVEVQLNDKEFGQGAEVGSSPQMLPVFILRGKLFVLLSPRCPPFTI